MSVAAEIEIGVVVDFLHTRSKSFGVVAVLDQNGRPTGEQLRFFGSGSRYVSHNGETARFGDQHRTVGDVKTSLPHPTKGQQLIFSRYKPSDGSEVIAAPWSYLTTWQCVEQHLAERPFYRVIHWWHYPNLSGDDEWYEKVVWEGQNTLQLSVLFPREQYLLDGQLHSEDALPTTELSDGEILHLYSFERLVDGDWVNTTDPRTTLCCISRSTLRHYAGEHARKRPCIHRL